MSERPTQAEIDGTTCEDEGCPHYGTPHSHPEANASHAQEVCEYCHGTGNDLIHSDCKGFVRCHVCGGNSVQEVEEQEDAKLLAEIQAIDPMAVRLPPGIKQLVAKLREKDAAELKKADDTISLLMERNSAHAATIAQQKEEITILHNELEKTRILKDTPFTTGYNKSLADRVNELEAELSASQEVLKLAEECGIHQNPAWMYGTNPQNVIKFSSKLRAKDAAIIAQQAKRIAEFEHRIKYAADGLLTGLPNFEVERYLRDSIVATAPKGETE